MQNWNVVKNMNESKFLNFIINQKSDGPFQDFVKYVLNASYFADNRICQILSVLPASSTNCERGFSQLSDIKRDNRVKLMGEHLESTLRISLTDMNEIEMENHAAVLIQKWRNVKQRRSVRNNPH